MKNYNQDGKANSPWGNGQICWSCFSHKLMYSHSSAAAGVQRVSHAPPEWLEGQTIPCCDVDV